jgi:hypothetical protein
MRASAAFGSAFSTAFGADFDAAGCAGSNT